ncbi:hypothetical protein HK100_008331 [Physocladia obscura]|uniref:Uncharacterized protein n=1 Tax=Physocladia obscura TaxID=109957 RepID=A0AAD5SNA8_9FUNG|nr:hypothetical protein HK100_008331 [Physocladia obscura]
MSLKLFEVHKKFSTSHLSMSTSETTSQDDETMRKTANSYIVVFRSISNVFNDTSVSFSESNDDSPPSPAHEEYVDAPTGPSPVYSDKLSDSIIPEQQRPRNQTPDSLRPKPTTSRTPSPIRQSSYVPDHMIAEAINKNPPPAFPPMRESSLTPSIASAATPAAATTATVAQPTVFLQGYLIEPNPGDPWNSCTVTVISHLSPDLAKLETNYTTCKKLKTFIEEVKLHFEQLEYGGGGGDLQQQPQRRNRVADASAAVGAGIVGLMASAKGQELKNYLVSSSAAAAGYLMKGKSRSTGSLLVVKNNSGGGSGVDSEIEDSDNDVAATEIADGNSSSVRPNSGASSSLKKNFDSESILSRTATVNSETASVVSASSYQKQRSELVSSAVAFAKNVGLRRPASISFLARAAIAAAGGGGIQQADSSIQSAGFSQPTSSFSIGDSPEPAEFIQKRIAPKETDQIEIPFRRQDFHATVELSWEFMIKDMHSITFGLSFRPDHNSAAYSNSMSSQFLESISESLDSNSGSNDVRQIIPLSSVANTAAIPSHRGNLNLSLFCSGTFVFFWDNSTGSGKKLKKEVWFRSMFRPFEIPTTLTNRDAVVSSTDDDMLGEYGFKRNEQLYCTGMTGEVTIAKKSLYRAFFTYDSSVERFNDAGEPETLTFLAWNYSTNGLEVMFGVSYYPAVVNTSVSSVENVPAAFEQGVLHSEFGFNVGKFEAKTIFEETPELVHLETGPNEPVLPPPKPTRRTQVLSPVASQPLLPLSNSVEKPLVAASLTAVAAKEQNSTSSSQPHEFSQQRPQHTYQSTYPFKPRSRPIPIIPLSKVKSNVGATLSGAIPIDNLKNGVYVFVWDNTTSVLLPKIVSFRVGLVTTALAAAVGGALAADSVAYEVNSPVIVGGTASGVSFQDGDFVSAWKE